MEKRVVAGENKSIYYRLMALWVVCEALLGGIIHGFRLPVSGLVVGSSAVICICLLAYYVPGRGAILKATLIVAIFKMMLSPQSPLPAYFAVFFQGFLGELIFMNRKHYRLAAVVFSILALTESAIQRILVVTLLYGKDIWTAVNDFITGLTGQAVDYSRYLVAFYLLAHLLTGLLVGLFAARLPLLLRVWKDEARLDNPVPIEEVRPVKKHRNPRIILFVVWLVLLLLCLQSYFSVGRPLLPGHISLLILIRSITIALSWYLVVGPALYWLLKKWLTKKQQASQDTVQEVMRLLPQARSIVAHSWQQSSSRKGLYRLSYFSKMVLVNTCHERLE